MNRLHFIILEAQPITASGIRQAVESIFAKLTAISHFQNLHELRENTGTETIPLVIIGPNIKIDNDYPPQIKKKFPKANIIAIQSKIICHHAKKLFKASIDALLCDHASLEELGQAIRKVINGEKYACSYVQKTLFDQSIGNQLHIKVLTEREKEVLQLIVDEFTTKEIAEKLYISSCTAETHRLNIIHKLGVRNTAGIVREALRMELAHL